mgnify:FL=1
MSREGEGETVTKEENEAVRGIVRAAGGDPDDFFSFAKNLRIAKFMIDEYRKGSRESDSEPLR